MDKTDISPLPCGENCRFLTVRAHRRSAVAPARRGHRLPLSTVRDHIAEKPGTRLARDLSLYTFARFLLVAVIGAVIVGVGRLVAVDVPLLVALLFAVIVALPLSLVVFKRLRSRVNQGIAAVDERRRKDKAELRARLRGDRPDDTGAVSDAGDGPQ